MAAGFGLTMLILVAFGLLVLQVVLSARFHFADRALGLDKIMRIHRAVGIVALVLHRRRKGIHPVRTGV